MSRLTSTRKMICALAEVVQHNGSAPNVSYDDADPSSGCVNTSRRKSSLTHKVRDTETSNEGEEINGSLDGSSGKRLSSSRGSSNKRCKVMPMVMGHVLQQPKLALPKMDPQTLRAIARENREVVRMENGFDMTVINEREISDEDPGSVSEEEEDEGSSNELQRGAESNTRPVMNPLLQNTEIPGNYHRRLLANMTGSTNKRYLVPRVSINADCSAAATAALLSSQRPTGQTHRSKAHESLDSSSDSDGSSIEQSLNDFQSRFPSSFAAECKSSSRQSVTEREGQVADIGDDVDLTYSPPPHQDLSLHSDSVVYISEDQDSGTPGSERKSKCSSKNGGMGKRSTNTSSQDSSCEGSNAQTELSDSGKVGGNRKLTSGDEDPLEGPSWLYSPEATSASCSLNRKTRSYVTNAKSFTRQQSSKKACDNDLLKPPNGRGTASIALNSFESSNDHQSNWITKENLPKLHVDHNSAAQDDIPTHIDSENILGREQPLHVPSRKSSAARRGRGRESSVSFNDLVQVLEDETECKIQARRTRSQLSSFDAVLAERYTSATASTDSTEQRSPILSRQGGLSHRRKSLKPQTKTDSRRSTVNNFRLVLDESSNSDDHEDSLVGVGASSAEQTQNPIEGTLGDNSELAAENRSEMCNLTALHLDSSAPSTPNRMRRRFEELEKMCPRRNRSRSKSGPAFSIHPENNDADALNKHEKPVALVESPTSSSASTTDSFSVLKEATVVLHRSLESPVDYHPKISSTEREESSPPPSSSGLNTLPTSVKSAASGKSPLKREDISRFKKAPVNETCLDEELMEMTLAVPSSSSSDFLQSFKASKSNPKALKSVDETAGNDEGSITSTAVKSADNSSVKSLRKGKGKQKGKHFKAESRTRNVADNPTEFDFSQMEATVLNIPPYSSAKNSTSSMDEEETTGNSAKRLSIVLVDVCKTDDANVVKETMSVDQDDDSIPNLVARSKRSRNNEKNLGDFTNHLIEESVSVNSTKKRSKKREIFPSVEVVSEHSIKMGDKRKSRSNHGLKLLGSSKRSRRNESISQDKSHSKDSSEGNSESNAVEESDSNESKLSYSMEDATSVVASTESCSRISKKCASEPNLCEHIDEGISDVLRSLEDSSECLSPRNKHTSSDEPGKDGSPRKKLMLSASPTSGNTSKEMNDSAVSESVFLEIRESSEPDPLEELDPERDPLGDLFPVIILSPSPKTGNTIDVTVNGKVSERSPSGKKSNAMLTTPQKRVISGESAATCGSGEDAGSGDGGEAATGHPRRAASKSVSYVEPKLNSKLRQGDSLSTRAYKEDGVFQTSKSAMRKARKKRK